MFLLDLLKQEGASDEDIRQLPKFKFRRIGSSEKLGAETSGPFGGIMTESASDSTNEHALSAEDAVSCLLRLDNCFLSWVVGRSRLFYFGREDFAHHLHLSLTTLHATSYSLFFE